MTTQSLPYSRAALRAGPCFSNQFAIIGSAASGKTALASRLLNASSKPLEHLSAGGVMRELQKRSGSKSITDFALYLRDHPSHGEDGFVDNIVRRHMAMNHRSLDTHLPVFAPAAFIIKLICPWEVCAERRAAQKGQSVPKVLAELKARDLADRERYEALYPGSTAWLETDFDFTVPTHIHSEERTFELVIEAHLLWMECFRSSIVTEDSMP